MKNKENLDGLGVITILQINAVNVCVLIGATITYNMISQVRDNQLPDPNLFIPPPEYVKN